MVNGTGVSIGQDIELGIGGKVVKGFQSVLVALNVSIVDLERELHDESLGGLDDVVVRCQEVVGGRLGSDGVEEVLDNAVTVNEDG